MKEVLERTLGVPIFQEQVMQLAIVAAGFTPGEADQLRRAMAAWRRKGGIEHFEQRLIDGMLPTGYTEEFAEQIYQQILRLRRVRLPRIARGELRPARLRLGLAQALRARGFLAAMLNSQPMGFYAPAQLVQDARRHGVEVRPSTSEATGIARSKRRT